MGNDQVREVLSRREREIMDVVYRRGQATVAEVIEGMAEPPSYSAVRALMNILEEKGHLRHQKAGARYVYLPTRPRQRAGKEALRRLSDTFFGGSVSDTVAALLDVSREELNPEEMDRLAHLIEEARKEGR
ncbi:MAG: BlaI/MecI/CopY family transcriptional regulator [Armatimonadota bacterium]